MNEDECKTYLAVGKALSKTVDHDDIERAYRKALQIMISISAVEGNEKAAFLQTSNTVKNIMMTILFDKEDNDGR
ncbi:hypothetical protein [Nicoliella lavandulae]|uniref:14-3-3 domain-containing protein n=1 Tax=Nicoliella lavandulae TaxID=3082954 RepID=A0ABU8SM94_9LACO